MDLTTLPEGSDTGQRPVVNFDKNGNFDLPSQPTSTISDYGSGAENRNFDQIQNDHKDDESNTAEHSDGAETTSGGAGDGVDGGGQNRRRPRSKK